MRQNLEDAGARYVPYVPYFTLNRVFAADDTAGGMALPTMMKRGELRYQPSHVHHAMNCGVRRLVISLKHQPRLVIIKAVFFAYLFACLRCISTVQSFVPYTHQSRCIRLDYQGDTNSELSRLMSSCACILAFRL